VWIERDRAKLVDSILRNYPLPAIFLYKREEDGHLVFDVIDGKQHFESILMFTGAMRGRFETRTQIPGSDRMEWVNRSMLKRKGLQQKITGCKIPVIEVDGEMGDIIRTFVRINSTGKALTTQERRLAFLAYCLHVSLRARLRALAPGLTPRSMLEKFAAIQMLRKKSAWARLFSHLWCNGHVFPPIGGEDMNSGQFVRKCAQSKQNRKSVGYQVTNPHKLKKIFR
jgi:hypothetical protein